MIVAHVLATAAPDYLTRRELHRHAHIARAAGLRAQGVLIGGGPAPDGQTADLFYRLADTAELGPLVEGDPYHVGGVWTAYRGRSFSQFVEPWELPPVALDGSRRVTIVEGPTADPDLAQLALVELRGAGRLAFGGCFDDGETLAVLRAAEPADAVAWLAESGFWDASALRARPWLHVL